MGHYQINTSKLNFGFNKKGTLIRNLNLLVPKGSIYGFLGGMVQAGTLKSQK